MPMLMAIRWVGFILGVSIRLQSRTLMALSQEDPGRRQARVSALEHSLGRSHLMDRVHNANMYQTRITEARVERSSRTGRRRFPMYPAGSGTIYRAMRSRQSKRIRLQVSRPHLLLRQLPHSRPMIPCPYPHRFRRPPLDFLYGL